MSDESPSLLAVFLQFAPRITAFAFGVSAVRYIFIQKPAESIAAHILESLKLGSYMTLLLLSVFAIYLAIFAISKKSE